MLPADPWMQEELLFVWKSLWIAGIPHGIMEWGAHLIPVPLHGREWHPQIPGSKSQLLQIPQDFVLPSHRIPDLPSLFFGIIPGGFLDFSRLQLFPQQLLDPDLWEASGLGCGCLGSLGRTRLETRNVNTGWE